MKKIFLTILLLMFGVSNQTQPFFSMDSMFDVTSWLIPQNLYVPQVTLSDVLTGTVQAIGHSLQNPKAGWVCAAAVVSAAGISALWYKSKKNAEISRLKKIIDESLSNQTVQANSNKVEKNKLENELKELQEQKIKLEEILKETEDQSLEYLTQLKDIQADKKNVSDNSKKLEVDNSFSNRFRQYKLNNIIDELEKERVLLYQVWVSEIENNNMLRGFLGISPRTEQISEIMDYIKEIEKKIEKSEDEKELKNLKIASAKMGQLKKDMEEYFNHCKAQLQEANKKIRDLEAQLKEYAKEEQ
ncbi:MAG: hypothetical protein WDZ41_00275 [Candidatus Babeliales bacterium]